MSDIASIVEAYMAGDFVRALTMAEQRLSTYPDELHSLSMCGLCLAALNRPAEAAVQFQRATLIAPDEPENLVNLGNALRESGQLIAGIQALEQAVSKGASGPEIDYDLGLAYLQSGRSNEAAIHLEHALDAMRTSVALHAFLARVYCELGRKEDAILLLDRLVFDEIGDPDVLNQLGIALNHLGRIEDAEAVLRRSLKIQPDLHEATQTLSSMYERQNRLVEAKLELDKIPESNDSSPLLLIRARLASRDKAYDRALAYFAKAESSISGDDRLLIDLHFDRGKIYDKLVRYDEAMQDFRAAHSASLSLFHAQYPGAGLQDPIADWNGDESSSIAKYNPTDALEDGSPIDPIFIVGFPRSGTTLLEQLLDSHPSLQSMDEQLAIEAAIDEMRSLGYRYPEDLDRVDAQAMSAVRRKYWDEVRKVIDLRQGARLVDKYPFNAVRLPFIAKLFPAAKVIMLLRHPADACLSCYMQKFRLNAGTQYWASLESTADLYARMMNTWLKHKQALEFPVHTLRYEDLVADMPGEVGKLLDFVGLDWDPAIMGYAERAKDRGRISTPSYAQVTEPISNKAVGRWKNYAPYLAPYLPVLAPFAARFGYEIDSVLN